MRSLFTALFSAAMFATSTAHAAQTVLRVGIFQDVTREAIEATGFLKDTPYRIEWARLNGAGPTVQALGGNAIDISWGLSDTAAPKASSEDRRNWTADNAPIKLIGLLAPVDSKRYSPMLVIAGKNSGITKLADLRGKSYAYNEGGNANAVGLLALDKAGLSVKDIKLRLLTYDATAPAVVAGAVDAAPATRSRVADALANGSVRELATENEVGFPGFVSVTARTAALKDPQLNEAIGDFMTRLARYLNWAATHDAETAAAYVKTQQLTQEQALFAAKSGAYRLVPVNRDGAPYKAEVAATKKLGEIGFYPRAVDFSSVVDDRYTAQIEAGNR
ncbi:aliphatic sulfonate ABC transporter substrate-binding protein [Caballeronia fortuita]|uniref:Aliphatic sulfonate ABC transporter substrate-binding protein n=1 Tax=Caballeronia fortuita TaxID=1777138 RepID=A0A158AWP8_9BURK|nr:ABC transporter substrate-binding protein [Caballeronia fortuita]SAK62129.1 aliphatic sulfonate ABC transporter substrate-binding protein [Caballeronia fortuita]